MSFELAFLFLLTLTAAPGGEQDSVMRATNSQRTTASPGGAPPAGKTPAGSNTVRTGISRWIEVEQASLAVRYRRQDNGPATARINQLQHRQAFLGRFSFDPEGDYTLNAAVLSGNTFTGSWNNTGVGTGDPVTNLHLEQLFLAMKPVEGLEIQYCGLPIVRGDSTEITSYDNDGYLVGERLKLQRPKSFFFDEIMITFGYLGDFSRPNLNKRFHRLKQSNYHQFLVGRRFGRRMALTADYTFHEGVETLREAIRLQTAGTRVFDSIRFENYQRLDESPAYGLAITGEKAISKRFSALAGWARIDPEYGLVNGDRYFTGKRVFATLNIRLYPGWTVSLYATRAFESKQSVPNRARFDAILSYDLAHSLAGILGGGKP